MDIKKETNNFIKENSNCFVFNKECVRERWNKNYSVFIVNPKKGNKISNLKKKLESFFNDNANIKYWKETNEFEIFRD